MKRCCFILLMFYSAVVFGKEPVGNYYWVQFNTKSNTPYSINKPEYYLSQRAIDRRLRHGIAIDSTDLPVNPTFVDSLRTLGFYVKHTSKWMNGAVVILPTNLNINNIIKPSFIDSYTLRKNAPSKTTIPNAQDMELKSAKFSDIDADSLMHDAYGNSYVQLSMISGHLLHTLSRGKGVQVAVIDAGFENSDIIPAFDSIRARNGILGTYDFVDPGNDVYREYEHGNNVFSIMAGNDPGNLIGAAPDASYWLLRTEDVNDIYNGATYRTESPVEEDYWIFAVEFADSVGCDVVNTSLGYTTFDNPNFNHTYEEFDGKTIKISKAANLAVDKGMVVVCSAGNSRNDEWGKIVAPSEAEKVLSVAAVDESNTIASFSSPGFTDDFAINKPDISALGVFVTYAASNGTYERWNGTSYASPIIAGMAACLVSFFPEKSATEIMDLIRELGNLYPQHSIDYGYGIPDFSKVVKLVNPDITAIDELNDAQIHVYPNPFTSALTITNTEGFKTFELFSSMGKRIISSNIDDTKMEISSSILSGLNKGVYFAVLTGRQKTQLFKLIKK